MLNVLLVSQNESALSYLSDRMEKKDVHTTWADSVHHGLSLMAERDFDLVVADENLGNMTGLEFSKINLSHQKREAFYSFVN